MGAISPADSMFLIGESREQPMHVAALQIFRRPPGAADQYVADLYESLLQFDRVRPALLRRPKTPVNTIGHLWWTDETDIDLEYHVRRSALPKPGGVRELLTLVSQLHGNLLDRHHPLWEFHLIDGLEDGRFATYTKIHHSLVDGIGMVDLLTKSLSADPATAVSPFWAADPAERKPPPPSDGDRNIEALQTLRSTAHNVDDFLGTLPALAKRAAATVRGDAGTPPLTAPRTIFNVPISGARRFAGQSWPLSRLKAIAAHHDATLNDVVLAICGAALRHYLVEQNAMPDRSLVAAVPVSLRARASGASGNAVGIATCELATDIDDPHERLRRIHQSMQATKATLSELTPHTLQAGALIAALPIALMSLPGGSKISPPANLVISNVPGPQQALYWNGALMEDLYPVSIPTDGAALNITVFSYNDQIKFGVTGCRRTVPHLQHLLAYLDESLSELEAIAPV